MTTEIKLTTVHLITVNKENLVEITDTESNVSQGRNTKHRLRLKM